jgi:hypothetical protein
MHKKEIKQNDKKLKTSFKNLLTKCCQDRLYEMRVHGETLAKNLIAIEDCPDQVNISLKSLILTTDKYNANKILQDFKAQLQSKYNEDEMVFRKRSVGNCRYERVIKEWNLGRMQYIR